MRRKRGFRRGRILSILLAAGAGYLLGSWNAGAVRSSEPSPAQTVALRFPQDINTAAAQPAKPQRPIVTASALPMRFEQAALFSPQPMVPHGSPQAPAQVAAPQAPASQAPVQVATAEPIDPPAAPAAGPSPLLPETAPVAREIHPQEPAAAPKPHPVAHHASRPGYMLDDAQIAGIRRRLHLSPDQERMWPAVAVALRNIGSVKAREATRRGPQSIDPDSTEVQDLKSAAIPLLMSFNSEQKDEVRNLAHVMGLDQLASQF
jgi:hypothetical protein